MKWSTWFMRDSWICDLQFHFVWCTKELDVSPILLLKKKKNNWVNETCLFQTLVIFSFNDIPNSNYICDVCIDYSINARKNFFLSFQTLVNVVFSTFWLHKILGWGDGVIPRSSVLKYYQLNVPEDKCSGDSFMTKNIHHAVSVNTCRFSYQCQL